ncbi:hypothetical protein D1157_17565, partial [Anaerotruncus sp. X29]|nr:hypothetical protein [Anaerotruncus sp. X29]
MPLRGNSPEKCASQEKAFRRVRAAAGALPLDPATFEKVDETFKQGSGKKALLVCRGGACGEGSPTPRPQGKLRGRRGGCR